MLVCQHRLARPALSAKLGLCGVIVLSGRPDGHTSPGGRRIPARSGAEVCHGPSLRVGQATNRCASTPHDTLDHLHILHNYGWDSRALLSLIVVGLPARAPRAPLAPRFARPLARAHAGRARRRRPRGRNRHPRTLRSEPSLVCSPRSSALQRDATTARPPPGGSVSTSTECPAT